MVFASFLRLHDPNMKNYLESLVRDLSGELARIEIREEDYLTQTQEQLKVVRRTLEEMESTISQKQFASLEEEIHYYKTYKPMVQRHLLFLQNVERIELELPLGCNKSIKDILRKEQKSLNTFYRKNKDKFEYYRKRCILKDEFFFVKTNLDKDWMGSIQAAELLNCYLAQKKRSLKVKDANPINSKGPNLQKANASLRWTAGKTELVELIYAMQALGCFNEGKATIKSIAELFELQFGINLSDYRYTFKEIKNRHQVDRFMNKLSKSLIRKVDEELDP